MKKLLLIPFFIANLVYGQNWAKWRWAVKTLNDSGGIQLLNLQPEETTIGQILTDISPQPLHTASMIDGQLARFTSKNSWSFLPLTLKR